jgi:hypothetical protein
MLVAQVAGSISRSKRALEEIYETGTNILGSMAASRERLKVGTDVARGVTDPRDEVTSVPAPASALAKARSTME